VALSGGTRESYGEVAFGGAVHGAGCLVQEWSCGVSEAECATGVGGHVALGVGVGEGMVRIGGKVGERLGEATGGGLDVTVTFWLYERIIVSRYDEWARQMVVVR
jgi:hypothetical protein